MDIWGDTTVDAGELLGLRRGFRDFTRTLLPISLGNASEFQPADTDDVRIGWTSINCVLHAVDRGKFGLDTVTGSLDQIAPTTGTVACDNLPLPDSGRRERVRQSPQLGQAIR